MQCVARLVVPSRMARQIASVAPVHVARQCGHAGGPSQHSAATAMTWPSLSRHMYWRDKPVAPCGLARQGQCPGLPASCPPPSLSFPRSTPTTAHPGSPPAAATPQIPPQNRIFLGEKVRGSVPHPSPKVLPLISHRLTVCISSYWWLF